MNSAQVRAKARMAMKRREEEIEAEEMESGELNLVPYLDIVTNVMLFLLATISAGFVLGNINTSLPEYAANAGAVNAAQDQPTDPPIGLIVSLTKPEILVWSSSGQEGTLETPKARIPAIKIGESYDYKQIGAAVSEIVNRRWPDKNLRMPETNEVILMTDGEIPYHVVVSAMDALREDKGKLLFPDIIFSTGIK